MWELISAGSYILNLDLTLTLDLSGSSQEYKWLPTKNMQPNATQKVYLHHCEEVHKREE